jgi:hypothetical protein
MLTDVSEVRATSIIKAMMEAARTSETSVDIQLRTWQNMPEDSKLQGLHNSGTTCNMYELIKLKFTWLTFQTTYIIG